MRVLAPTTTFCYGAPRSAQSSRIFSHSPYASLGTTRDGRMADEILTIREVAELLKINEKTAYKLALAREIPGFKVGGSWRFQRQEIANWIKRKVEEQQGGGRGA
ncbi:putative transcriptional regulatory protein [Granulibacter bethesdensis]|uniref:Transcriptional regulatory protein n=2 Tax=Granulibacter bethesdensis TaxID=364410 RepID=A0AAC9P8W9_9PROT|nr:putative transcriptional regulatory protein [Granulibacter bethesdensis]APH62055.1 putative transcriptional regulatory protein [Granulibacter bethesdensis]